MNPSTVKHLEVIATAVGAAAVAWGVLRLLGVDLPLNDRAATDSVGIVDVVFASTVAGFAAWGVNAFMVHREKQRYWPFVATTALSISLIGPGYMADGGDIAVALMALHFAVAIPLILGFARLSPVTPHDPRYHRPAQAAEYDRR